MITSDYIRTMAEYNADEPPALWCRGAAVRFREATAARRVWGSIHGTLTHIL
jgi:hypothetical protein